LDPGVEYTYLDTITMGIECVLHHAWNSEKPGSNLTSVAGRKRKRKSVRTMLEIIPRFRDTSLENLFAFFERKRNAL